MKVLVVTDSFKGSMTSVEAAESIKLGILKACPDAEVNNIPISDGGEGLCEAVAAACGGSMRKKKVMGPLGDILEAEYCVLPDKTAVIEMAKASGYILVKPSERNPMSATTYGTGELVKDALDLGCRKIIVGIGGSATNDGGMGMAQALGVRFKDSAGNDLAMGGGELNKLVEIDISGLDSRIAECEFIVACDVNNPLCGENGASYVYGPQKGATPEMIEVLDRNLRHYAKVIKEQLNLDIADMPGAGAAGGLGAGLVVFCHASLKKGIDIMLDLIQFEKQLENVDLVITGEGKIDNQSLCGKVPVGIAKRVKAVRKIPVVAIVAQIAADMDSIYACGIDGVMATVNGAMDLEIAISKAKELTKDAAERMMNLILIGKNM